MTVNCTLCSKPIENRQMFVASKDPGGHWLAMHDHCIPLTSQEFKDVKRFMMNPARREVLTEKVN